MSFIIRVASFHHRLCHAYFEQPEANLGQVR